MSDKPRNTAKLVLYGGAGLVLIGLLWYIAMDPPAFLIGGAFGGVFAVVTWRVGFLRWDGALAGGLFGWSLIAVGTFAWIAPAVAFFVLSSALSCVGKAKKQRARQMEAKGSERDAGQVLANGGVAWGLLLLHALDAESLYYWGFVGAFASAAADTWATEIGTLSHKPPRSILTGQVLHVGQSGGVSFVGSLGALAGAAVISAIGVIVSGGSGLLWIGLTGVGFVASFVDSLLGATVQAIYRDKHTGWVTERPIRETEDVERIQGWAWVTNDVVNWGCTLFGAAGTILLFAALGFAS